MRLFYKVQLREHERFVGELSCSSALPFTLLVTKALSGMPTTPVVEIYPDNIFITFVLSTTPTTYQKIRQYLSNALPTLQGVPWMRVMIALSEPVEIDDNDEPTIHYSISSSNDVTVPELLPQTALVFLLSALPIVLRAILSQHVFAEPLPAETHKKWGESPNPKG